MATWRLDLCFKEELKQWTDVELNAHGKFREGPLEVTIYLVSEPPFGTVQRVEYDSQLVRLRQPDGGSAVAPKRVHHGVGHGPQIDTLFAQPGLSNLSEQEQDIVSNKFRDHLTFVVKADKTKPTFYRCTSLGTLYQGNDVVLYLPPENKSVIENRKTITNLKLPMEPTLYRSPDEAMYLPLLLDLSENRTEVTMDLIVALTSNGPAHMTTARLMVMGMRDQQAYLPWLKGSLKQSAWASEIREQAVQILRQTARDWGHKDVPPPYTKVIDRSPYRGDVTKENIRDLLDELNLADEAKGWIDNRKITFAWLADRVKARLALGELGKYKPTEPLVVPPFEWKKEKP